MSRNDGIFVRCTPHLLAAVDKVRGGRTRPEFARACMEKVIQGTLRQKQAAEIVEIVDPVSIAERATGRKPPLKLPKGVKRGADIASMGDVANEPPSPMPDVETRFKK